MKHGSAARCLSGMSRRSRSEPMIDFGNMEDAKRLMPAIRMMAAGASSCSTFGLDPEPSQRLDLLSSQVGGRCDLWACNLRPREDFFRFRMKWQ